jgi:effector-binding domain-containing protein
MPQNIELRAIPSRPALVVHEHCNLSEMGEALGPIFGEVASWAGAHGIPIAGPAVARYLGVEAGECDMDAGFVVAEPAAAEDVRVHAVDLGGCTAACATHMGSYESLPETYRAISEWMTDHGYVSAGPMWEEYFSPPGTPPEETRTDIYWPVRRP